MRIRPPWPARFTINTRSPYGWRVHPITGTRKFHHGVDVAMPIGTELVAPADGDVAHKGSGASGGFTLILKHADNLYTVYYHLAKPSFLAKGATVREGQLIAYSGNTGASTGPHLHFETRRSKTWGDTFNPVDILDFSPETPQEPISEPQPVSDSEAPKEAKNPLEANTRPSMLNKVPDKLKAWSNSWIARGKWANRGK